MNLADVVQRESSPPVWLNTGLGVVRTVEPVETGPRQAEDRIEIGLDVWNSGGRSAAVRGVQDHLNTLRVTLDERVATTVRQTGMRLADRGPGHQSLFPSFERTAADLFEVEPDLMQDYLALVNTILDEGDRGALDGFLSRVYEVLKAGAGSEKLSAVFHQAMDRLKAMDRISARVEVEVRVRASGEEAMNEADPLVLDLAGDGVNLTGAAKGVMFDIDGDGRKERTSFVQGDDAFLALDRNGNGRIDDGKELFGDQHGAAHGFAELARFDGNADGRIDRNDEVYQHLRVFQDKNGNGDVEAGEIRGLEAVGVEAVELAYEAVNRRTASGDRVTQQGVFVRSGGQRGMAVDAMVGFLDTRV
ncbi:MAG: hypothetical protein O2954_17565 [bacterium]|nr:hypothetical protein [bacterium]